MSFNKQYAIKEIRTCSPQQEKTVHILVEELCFSQIKDRKLIDHCALVFESLSGYEAVVDCDGLINGKNIGSFMQDFKAWLNAQHEILNKEEEPNNEED